jgi:hypothetical protein
MNRRAIAITNGWTDDIRLAIRALAGPARGWFLPLARPRQSFHFALSGNANESSRRPVEPVPGGKS